MRKIRILQLPVANARGGITQYVLNNLKHIDRGRFTFDLVTRSKNLDFADEVADLGGRIHYLSCSSLEDEKTFIREMSAILDTGYDAVHLHTSYWNGLWAEKLAMERHCPAVIVHAHSTNVDLVDPEKRHRALELHYKLRGEFSERLANRFCACSMAAADWLFGANIPREKIRLFNNAVDVEAYAYNPGTREKMRRELGLAGRLVLGQVGRFTYQKNHALLLDIFARVRETLSEAVLMLIGDGELQGETRHRAAALGLEKDVLFLGRRADVPDLMQAMDIYLQPSRFEGLGLVLVEAQTAGLPCLASEFVPPEARVGPNLTYLPYDAEVWAEKVLALARASSPRRDCSGLTAEAGYSLKEQIKQLERLYTGEDY